MSNPTHDTPDEASKFFVVLGVDHRVQGDKDHPGSFDDPVYRDIVREIISNDHIDFVAEECNHDTTDAEKIADESLGAGHYSNVDILMKDRANCGIGETFLPPRSNFPVTGYPMAFHQTREKKWVEKLVERTSTRGLLICGFVHAFSVSFRLMALGFKAEARTYIPWEKLSRKNLQLK